MKRILPVAIVSALLGSAAAVGIVSAFDLGGGQTTTVVEQAPLQSTKQANSDTSGLTARDIYKRDAPGVAFVKATVVQRTPSMFDFGMPQEQQGEATGSGFVINKNGTILTNAHVVNGATKVTVSFQNNKTATAKVLGKDESTDLAVLKVDPSGLELHPLPLGDSSTVQVGDPTIAIGNPFGLERTLTTGVISATKRTIQAPNNFQIDNVLQTDAAINPGNSGGPLIDSTGRVIGINSQIETGGSGSSGGNIGIGFAIPINTAKRIVPVLEKTGSVQRGYLGVQTITIDNSLSALNLPVSKGALVEQVTPGSPAAKAGIQAGNITAELNGNQLQLGGDIVTTVDGKSVATNDDLANAIARKKPGQTVKITLLHHGKKKTVTVTLANRPDQAAASQTP